MAIRNFEQLIEAALKRAPKRVAIVGAGQQQTLHAARLARGIGLARSILIDDRSRLQTIAAEEGVDLAGMEIIEERDMVEAAYKAVAMVHAGEVDLVMNGRALPVENATAEKITVAIPPDAAGKELHLILEVRDRSEIVPLVTYRRAVIAVAK